METSSVSVTTLHIQFYCENGGGVYDRNSIIINNLLIILWNSRISYHKYCLNYNFGYYFEQIKKHHITLSQSYVVFTI